MAARKRKRRAKAKFKVSLTGKKAKLSVKRGHRPTELLRKLHVTMGKNYDKLGQVIRRREAIGE